METGYDFQGEQVARQTSSFLSIIINPNERKMSWNYVAIDLGKPTNVRSVFVDRSKFPTEALEEFLSYTWPSQEGRPEPSNFKDLSPGYVQVSVGTLRSWLVDVVSDHPFVVHTRVLTKCTQKNPKIKAGRSEL